MTTNGALLSVYGFIKPDADAYNGYTVCRRTLRDCGYETVLADHDRARLHGLSEESAKKRF